MKERPIIFSGEMVRAILDGRKTQTRRVINPQPEPGSKAGYSWFSGRDSIEIRNQHGRGIIQKVPYGQPGDRLCVRETWSHDDLSCKDIRCEIQDHIWYKASEAPIVADSFAGDAHWRSAIHMPRWASRITLEITRIRVERLQEITEHAAWNEGVGFDQLGILDIDGRVLFKDMWDSINAKRGFPWESNPWVWVIEFKEVEVNHAG